MDWTGLNLNAPAGTAHAPAMRVSRPFYDGPAFIVFVAYLVLSSYNQLLLLPFERAFNPALTAVPAVVVAAPVFITAAFHVGVLLVVAASLSAWVYFRFTDDPLAHLRKSLSFVSWSHLPLLLWSVASLPLLVSMLGTFDGVPITPHSVVNNASNLEPLKLIGFLRPFAWWTCLLMMVGTLAVQRGSFGQALAIAVPPIAALLILGLACLSLVPA